MDNEKLTIRQIYSDSLWGPLCRTAQNWNTLSYHLRCAQEEYDARRFIRTDYEEIAERCERIEKGIKNGT